jgi:hypothetical protein
MSRRVALAAASVAFVVLSATPALAHMNPHRIPRYYTATITPADAWPGADTTFVFRITESPGSKGSIGSANIHVPTGFAILDPGTVATFDMNGAPTGKTWTASLDGSMLELRTPHEASQRIQPTEYLELTFQAQVTCTAGTYMWKSAARVTNDFHNNGINFVIAKTQPIPRVSVDTSC